MTVRKQIELPGGEVIEVPPGMPSWAIDLFVDEWSAALDRQTADRVSAALSRVRAFLDARGARAAEDTERAGGPRSDAEVLAAFDDHYLFAADLRVLLIEAGPATVDGFLADVQELCAVLGLDTAGALERARETR